MEAMLTSRDGPERVLGLVIAQADWANSVIGLGKASALTQDCFRIGFYDGPIQAG